MLLSLERFDVAFQRFNLNPRKSLMAYFVGFYHIRNKQIVYFFYCLIYRQNSIYFGPFASPIVKRPRANLKLKEAQNKKTLIRSREFHSPMYQSLSNSIWRLSAYHANNFEPLLIYKGKTCHLRYSNSSSHTLLIISLTNLGVGVLTL